ncbi:PstS family phosphate ABC transporter substrate-binding protein [Streptomyces boluensis]|uniref:Phosphate ABC transporter substrate-binding protein n=1 Tax=Streptomyces boluensis TaxID=1775135 RepID=A0A964UWA4_9ACTN|nr:substrate-binding domain-containing protein [Streptomyces boluensis]NBE55505.1 phosphate ABC transporter substrate-binding protein [Streptomyces boluensis]
MDWLSAENVIAVGTALLGVFASLAALWYERRVPRRKRIGYRVQMDTPIGSEEGGGRATVRLGLFDEDPSMTDATLVLLRVENDGSQSIAGDDYTGREPHGLTAEFSGRVIRGIAVTQPGDTGHLMEHFAPTFGLRHSGSTLRIPRVPLNHGEHFKLLVLLTGGHVGDDVRITGGIRDGEVRPNRSTTPDDTPPLLSRPARLLTGLLTLSVMALSTLIVVGDDVPPPMGCAEGRLTVVGSTAFKPVAEELADKYEKDCPGSDIEVDAHGSAPGINELDEKGAAAASAPALIAFSDGPKPSGHPRLRENRVAVSSFAMVLSDRVPLKNLSLADLRRVYRGEFRTWRELDPALPALPVVLVSRNSNSGTRAVFQRRILRGFESAPSSADCIRKDDPKAALVRCEADSTEELLTSVAKVPGAIGYAELRSADVPKGLHRISLDGAAPTIEDIAGSSYPFREIEHAYTYGRPPADSLASSFLNYTMRGSGQDVIRTHGHVPCAAPEGLRVCGDGPEIEP